MEVTQLSELNYVAGPADGYNNFPHPDYVADAGGKTYFSSSLVVEVNGVVKTATTHYTVSGGLVTFGTALTAGDVCRIYRTTTIATPLVSFPNTTQLDAETHLNKNTYQLLWLIQELMTAVFSCLRWVYSSVHKALVVDMGSKNLINLKDPTEAQDAATKAYSDLGEATAKGYADTIVNNLQTWVLAYIHAYWPTTGTTMVTGDMIVPSSSPLTATQTRIYFPVEVHDILLSIGGIVQRRVTDYTLTAGNNYVDLVAPLGFASVVNALVFTSATGTTTLFEEEVVSMPAGDTTITLSKTFDRCVVAISGILQNFGTDYTHVFGTNTITFSASLGVTVNVTVWSY